MKIEPAAADPDAVPHGTKGVQVRDTRWGWIAQKRPGPPKKPPTKLQEQYRQRFAFAARMAANPFALDLATAIEMAKGTEQVPRDILTMAALGRYYEIVNPDGSTWGHVDGPVVSTDLGEQPEPKPEPNTEEGPEMEWNLWDAAWTAPNSASSAAFKGTRLIPLETRSVTRVAAILNTVSGGTYRAAIGTHDASGVITAVTLSDVTTATQTAHTMLTFPIAADLELGTSSFILVGRTDAGATYALPVYFSAPPRWLWPAQPGMAITHPTLEPAVGQTLTLPNANTTPPLAVQLTAPA